MNEMIITLKKKQEIKLTMEQGWYSVPELQALGWSAPDTYCSKVCKEALIDQINRLIERKAVFSLRSRIQGAVAKCTALGESHCRRTPQRHVGFQFFLPYERMPIPYMFVLRRNQYDGEMEYFVTIKETAVKTETSSYEEEHKKRSQAWLALYMCHFFGGVNVMLI